MAYSDEQIKNYAYQLQAKGASTADIESFVKSAKAGQNAGSTTGVTNSPGGIMGSVENAVGGIGNTIGKVAGGVNDFLKTVDSPFVGVAAIPAQLTAKALGQPDPYANNSMAGIPVTPLNLEKKAGDVIQAGATAASFAAAPETVLGSAAAFGGVGATQAAGASMSKGSDLLTTAKNAFTGGLTGAIIGAAGATIQKGITAMKDKGPEAFYNSALNVSSKIKAAGKSPSGFLADEGVWGTLGSMSKSIQQGISDENDNIANKVDQSTETVSYDQIKKDAIDSLNKKFGSLYSKSEIESMIDNVPVNALKQNNKLDILSQIKSGVPMGELKNFEPSSVSMKTANEVRQQLGKFVGDTKWLQSNPTESTSAAQAVYGALSSAIKKATDTEGEFSRLSQWIEAKKAIGKALLAADKKWLPGFYDWTAGAIGGIGGLFAGNPLMGALGTVALERATRSPTVLTGGAQLLKNLPQIGGALGRAASTDILGKTIGNN